MENDFLSSVRSVAWAARAQSDDRQDTSPDHHQAKLASWICPVPASTTTGRGERWRTRPSWPPSIRSTGAALLRSQRIRDELHDGGFAVSRDHVSTLMRR